MAGHRPGSDGPIHPVDEETDQPVTLAYFLDQHRRAPDRPLPADLRRRTEVDRQRYGFWFHSPTMTPATGDELLRRPSRTNIMQDLPSLPPPSNPLPTQPSPSTSNTVRERGSLEPLPRWQPDHEVSACPVCKTNFSFFFRKHHCRKCGRVVCNNCSPHRITIPRQYVVQPPSGDEREVSEAYPARNLGGGEVVRVCNPCVPDPWTPEAATREASNQARPRVASPESATGGDEAPRVRQRYRSYVGTHSPLPPPAGRMRAQSDQPLPNLSISLPVAGRPRPSTPDFGGRHIPAVGPRPRHRSTQSGIAPPPYNTIDPRARRLSAAIAAGSSRSPPAYRQRREVPEEDECPVCGEELPPGEDIRKAHIEECITTRFGTPSNTNSGMPNERSSSLLTNTRRRASTFRPRGMAVYKATEKDCVDGEGEAQECVICFEEFQAGDEMGRMECLCKFHRACIKRWWETKGAGSCPTHQLHE